MGIVKISLLSSPCDRLAVVKAAIVNIHGMDKSIPPVRMAAICPMAVIPRKEAVIDKTLRLLTFAYPGRKIEINSNNSRAITKVIIIEKFFFINFFAVMLPHLLFS